MGEVGLVRAKLAHFSPQAYVLLRRAKLRDSQWPTWQGLPNAPTELVSIGYDTCRIGEGVSGKRLCRIEYISGRGEFPLRDPKRHKGVAARQIGKNSSTNSSQERGGRTISIFR